MEKNGVKIILIGSAKLKNIKTIFLILFVCLLLSCENKTNDSRRTLSYKLGALGGRDNIMKQTAKTQTYVIFIAPVRRGRPQQSAAEGKAFPSCNILLPDNLKTRSRAGTQIYIFNNSTVWFIAFFTSVMSS